MSPLADALRDLRYRKGLRQQELADIIGCERSYLSALENDQKRLASDELVDRIATKLELSADEADWLRSARARSKRVYVVAPDTPRQGYDVAYALFERLEGLSELQVQAIQAVLQMVDPVKSPGVEGRIRRRAQAFARKEVTM